MKQFRKKTLSRVMAVNAGLVTMLTLPTLATAALLEEVVVTAQKRESSTQDLGMAVNAFSGENMDKKGWESANDVASLTPNLEIKNQLGGSTPVITIRGVGMNDVNPNVAPSAGVYIDEIFLPSTVSLNFGLFDVERVEVLKGPQGTLYGRNSTAGAVNFITRRPHEEFEAYVDVGYDEYQKATFKGAINGALTDNLSGRFAWSGANSEDGYFENRATGQDDYGQADRFSARGSLLWDLSNQTQVYAKLELGRDKSDSGGLPAHLGLNDAPGRSCNALTEGFDIDNAINCVDANGYQDIDGNPFKGDWNAQGDIINGNTAFEAEIDAESVSGLIQVDHEVGEMTLTSLTGYLSLDFNAGFDNDGAPTKMRDGVRRSEIEQYSQEFRLSGETENSNWIVGVFYSYDEVIEPERTATQDDTGRNWHLRMNFDQETTTAAAYGHTTITLSEELEMVAGIRYTLEDREFDGHTLIIRPDLTTVVRDNFYDAEVDEENISGKIGLNYNPNNDLMLYTSLSNAFKSAGFNGGFISNPAAELVADPEEIIAFEAGTKWTLLDGAMQMNLAYFQYDYTDMQVRIRRPSDVARVLGNAKEVDVKGLDFELSWAASDELTLRFGAGYIDSEVNDDDLLANAQTFDATVSELELANAPELSLNGSVTYEKSIGDNMALGVLVDVSWADEQFLTTENWTVSEVDSQYTVNANIYVAGGDKWRASLFAKNLTDEENLVRMESVGGGSGALIGYFAPPRTVGVNFRYNWGE